MKELVGICSNCQTEVFCENGFLNGVLEDGRLLCFPCDGKEKDEDKKDKESKS